MIFKIYLQVLSVIAKKPFKLWGVSLLSELLILLGFLLFGLVPGVAICIAILISTSMTLVFLRGYRGDEVHAVQLFDCCKNWKIVKRVLCGVGWSVLWIFLWGLIPIVGPIFAVIRAYQYRFVPYILAFESEVSVTDALKVSKERAQGHVGQMFLADLLFVGGSAVLIILLALLSKIPFVGVIFLFVMALVVLIVAAFGSLLTGLVKSAFYEEICN